MRTRLAFYLALVVPLGAQETPESPAALVLSGSDARVVRASSALPIRVQPGELLFARDSVSVGSSALTLIARGEKLQRTYEPRGPINLRLRPRASEFGPAVGEKAAECFLPPLPRSIVASQQDGGAAVAQDRTRDAGSLEQRLQAVSSAKRQELLNKLNAAGVADSADPVIHLSRASVLIDSGFALDAAEEMRRVPAAWPQAAWARSRLFVLEEEAARSVSAQARFSHKTTPCRRRFTACPRSPEIRSYCPSRFG